MTKTFAFYAMSKDLPSLFEQRSELIAYALINGIKMSSPFHFCDICDSNTTYRPSFISLLESFDQFDGILVLNKNIFKPLPSEIAHFENFVRNKNLELREVKPIKSAR